MESIEADEEMLLLTLMLKRRRDRRRKSRKVWVRKMYKERKEKGAYVNLIKEMRISDREAHFRYELLLLFISKLRQVDYTQCLFM